MGRWRTYRLWTAYPSGEGREWRAAGEDAKWLDQLAADSWNAGVQYRRHAGPADWRLLPFNATSCAQHQRQVAALLSVLLRSWVRGAHRAPAEPCELRPR